MVMSFRLPLPLDMVDLFEAMLDALTCLSRDEQHVLCCRYGLTSRGEVSTAALARELQMTPVQVNRIEARALESIRMRMGVAEEQLGTTCEALQAARLQFIRTLLS